MRSIRNKLTELDIFLAKYKKNIHVIIATEVWIYKNEEKYYNVKGYKAIFNCREINRGGGTVIFVKEGLKFSVIENVDKRKIW